MKNILTTVLATTAMAVAAPAFAADQTYKAETKIERNDDGSYKKDVSAERKDATGKVAAEVKTELDVDADGNSTKKVSTKDVRDPKGLLNKETVKTQQTTKVIDGKVSVESEKTVNGDTVEQHSSDNRSY